MLKPVHGVSSLYLGKSQTLIHHQPLLEFRSTEEKKNYIKVSLKVKNI